jgi:spermidine synthase
MLLFAKIKGVTMKNLMLVFSMVCGTLAAYGESWYGETLHSDWRQTFLVQETLYEEKTPEQHLIIFNNPLFGKVLALDGVIQTTEGDEFVYHEMLIHVPFLTHGNVKNALVIGGGDGGSLREILKHKTLEKVVLVEIDPSVIEFSKKHLPSLSQGAFDDPRVEIVIQDGCQYVKNCNEKYDVIVCDSTDPIGPGEVLFTSEFYGDCHRLLSGGGIFVNQSGVPYLQKKECLRVNKNLKDHFKTATYYIGAVPTYAGGFMAFGWATDREDAQAISIEALKERLGNVTGEMKYYTPEVHKASFALPNFMIKAISEGQL